MSDVTRILDGIEHGNPKAADELLALVYEELRRLAAHKMAQQPPGQTLQATALVHEAYLRLVASENQRWDHRGHFFAAAAEALRHILVDNARRKRRGKHGGDQRRVEVDAIEIAAEVDDEKLLLVNDALEKLAAEDPIKAEVVKLHYITSAQTHAWRAGRIRVKRTHVEIVPASVQLNGPCGPGHGAAVARRRSKV